MQEEGRKFNPVSRSSSTLVAVPIGSVPPITKLLHKPCQGTRVKKYYEFLSSLEKDKDYVPEHCFFVRLELFQTPESEDIRMKGKLSSCIAIMKGYWGLNLKVLKTRTHPMRYIWQ